MGYIRHHAIAVTGWGDYINNAHKKAKKIFGTRTSDIIYSNINGYRSFFIAPDGSNEGRETSNEGDKQRQEFIDWVEKGEGVDYCEFFYGDDNGNAGIVSHN